MGYAVERFVLNPLEPGKSYDSLQGTAQDKVSQLLSQREAAKADEKFIEQWLPTASETDLVNYLDRSKLYGERSAIDWLRQRQAGK